MRLAVSTNWNSRQHADGESLLEEIRAVGVDAVELGYALTHRQAAEIGTLRLRGAVRVESVHAFCPVPMGAVSGNPEIFTICHRDDRQRRRACEAVLATARVAAEMEAGFVVLHAGRVPVQRAARKLAALAAAGRQDEPRYERQLERLLSQRDRRCDKVLDRLRQSLELLLPAFESLGLVLALENLPSWDALPNEAEATRLLAEFPTRHLACWHDFGHAQVRHNLGLIHHESTLRRLLDHVAGFHVQDTVGVEDAHLVPPRGTIDFERFRDLAALDRPAVLEPAPGTPAEQVREAVDFLRRLWA